MCKYLAGIDIGYHGAIAVIENEGCNFVKFIDYPRDQEQKLFESLLPFKGQLLVCIEYPQTFSPGSKAIRALAITYGVFIAYLRLLESHIKIVSSQKNADNYWKKYFNLDNDKNKSIALAIELFPEAEPYLKYDKPVKPRNREQELYDIYSDDRAEALLIALYLKQVLTDEHSTDDQGSYSLGNKRNKNSSGRCSKSNTDKSAKRRKKADKN